MQLSHSLLLLLLLLSCLVLSLQAAVVPLDAAAEANANTNAGYLELKPNGTLILSSASNPGAGNLQNLLLLRSVLQALKLTPGQGQAKLNIKIYGEGVEHKFPPVVENIIQRIQTYFSIYRYTDTSRPVRLDELNAAHTQAVAETTEQPQENLVVKEQEKPETNAESKPPSQSDSKPPSKPPSKPKPQPQPQPQDADKWITVGENE
ncbi:hypothetical protein KR222_010043 [Zaprionus bogoriensis]|nr:hypothetical protein KR222_010043 [Zaprionus bogoriensis]